MQSVTHEVNLGFVPDLAMMLRPMQRGAHDPTMRFTADGVWRATATPMGPATQLLSVVARGAGWSRVASRCWGPGAQWLSDRVADLVGAYDDPWPFAALVAGERTDAGELVARLWRRHAVGWRMPRGHNVWESAVGAVLEQKVTGLEAKRAWTGLVRQFGTPAPGPAPAGMAVLPDPRTMRRVPTWTWRRLGVDRSRSDTIMRLAAVPHVLERLCELPHHEARRRLTSIPGVGEWTYAEIAQRALGDADAVSVGDFHLAGEVVYALTGRLDGDDAGMLRLLAPYAGHRYRAVRMIEVGAGRRPRRGPRFAIPAHRYG